MRSGPAARTATDGDRERSLAARLPRWAWSLLGGAIGLGDFAILLALDANMMIGEQDATLLIGLLFFIPYTLLGWAVGGLALARERADRDRETIARQLVELERTQRALVQEEKLAGIGRLAAGVAHEVRNPLGVIRASASMARESFDSNSDPYRALGFVCEETDRLDRLIASLLTFAKPQSLECVPSDIAKVIDRALDLARGDARRADVALEATIAPGLPPAVVDPDALAQAIYGLTLNAVQAMAAEGTAGTVAEEAAAPTAKAARRVLIRAEAAHEGLRIEVLDSGPGIPEALRDQVFEPFVTSKETGTGLGLPMALRLVEAQRGTLRLAEPGEPPGDPAEVGLTGARFAIELPVPESSAS